MLPVFQIKENASGKPDAPFYMVIIATPNKIIKSSSKQTPVTQIENTARFFLCGLTDLLIIRVLDSRPRHNPINPQNAQPPNDRIADKM